MIRTETDNRVDYTFDSWSEFVDHASKTTVPEGTWDPSAASKKPASPAWCAASWAESLKLAQVGWTGADQEIAKIASTLGEVFGSQGEQMAFVRDVCGEEYDIGAFVEGIPECAWRPTPEITKRRGHFAIVVPIGGACSLSDESFKLQGALVCALVKILEDAGQSCEVAIESLSGTDYRVSYGYRMHVPIKAAGDPLDMPFLAFAVAHAATFRRFVFATMEQDRRARQMGVGRGYGVVNFSGLTPSDFSIPEVRVIEEFRRGGGEIGHLVNWLRQALKAKDIIE